jgi:prepilin-type N-terminal cleavage/methylation domain-containing protein
MNRRRPSPQQGFTLIELLVVIAIIALLSAILLSALRSAYAVARRVQCGAQMNQIGRGFLNYANANRSAKGGDHFPFGVFNDPTVVAMPTNANLTYNNSGSEQLWNPNLASGGDERRGWVNAGLLIRDRLVTTTNAAAANDPTEGAEVFYCPAFSPDHNVGINGEDGLFAWRANRPRNLRHPYFYRTTYSYQPDPVGAPSTWRRRPLRLSDATKAVYADIFPARPNNTAEGGLGVFGHTDGYNVLFSDGSLRWFPDLPAGDANSLISRARTQPIHLQNGSPAQTNALEVEWRNFDLLR